MCVRRRGRITQRLFNVCGVALAATTLNVAACDREGDSASLNQDDQGRTDSSGEPAQLWRPLGDDAFLIEVPDDEAIAAELAAASLEARESAEAARLQWADAVLSDRRTRWLVKWVAPKVGGEGPDDVEHVWVRPLEWSPFRIEGVLVTDPRADIGSREGELVAFAIEQLSDWVHFVDAGGIETREGGFTLEVLERHFGTPKLDER